MVYCKKCGVELETDVKKCPLCGTPVTSGKLDYDSLKEHDKPGNTKHRAFALEPQKKVPLAIVAITVTSGIITTCTINLVEVGHITWAKYPITFCLMILSYVFAFALKNVRIILQMAIGFASTFILTYILDVLTQTSDPIIPISTYILLSANLVVAAFIFILRLARYKSTNLIAFAFIGGGILSVFVDGILSFFLAGSIQLHWSFIVLGCVFPVSIVLLYIHGRLKKTGRLEKTFHI